MKKIYRSPIAIAAFAALMGLTACEQEGPFEQAGEEIDQAAEDAGNAVEDACEELKEETGASDDDC